MLFVHGSVVAVDKSRYSLTIYSSIFYSYIFNIAYYGKFPQIIEIFGIFITLYGISKLLIKKWDFYMRVIFIFCIYSSFN